MKLLEYKMTNEELQKAFTEALDAIVEDIEARQEREISEEFIDLAEALEIDLDDEEEVEEVKVEEVKETIKATTFWELSEAVRQVWGFDPYEGDVTSDYVMERDGEGSIFDVINRGYIYFRVIRRLEDEMGIDDT